MFMRSKITYKTPHIILSIVTAVMFVLTANDSFARPKDRSGGERFRVAREGVKKRVVSPRSARQGYVTPKLPTGYRRAWHKREPYFYFGGMFYRPARTGFIVVAPPVGLVVVSLPVGYTRVWIGSVGYYVYGGIFYRRVPAGYVVVEPPTDVVIVEDDPVIVQPSETASGKVSVKSSVLNVRSGPGLNYPVIYQIQEGYILEIHGKADGWLYVELPNGQPGWVMTEFTLQLEPPASG